jgi:hypothetical protein
MFKEEEIAHKMQKAGAETLVCRTASSADLLKAIYGNSGDRLGAPSE